MGRLTSLLNQSKTTTEVKTPKRPLNIGNENLSGTFKVKGAVKKNIGPKSGKKFDVKGHPLPDTGKGAVKTEQARLVKKVKPKSLGRDKGNFRKVKGGFKRRRFSFDQRQDFRTMRNIPEHGPTSGRPKPKKRKPKGPPHGPTEGRPVVDPGSLT